MPDQQHEQEQNEEEADDVGEPSTATGRNASSDQNIRWLEIRHYGVLKGWVDMDDPAHIRLITKEYGRRKVIELWTLPGSMKDW